MKVAYLTAGAGGMYCGSCMRDNALAAALRRRGRDIALLPVYSPIRTDEENVSENRVVFGGINVYLQHRYGLFRRAPRLLDRLLDHPALLRRAMKNAGGTSPEAAAPLTVTILRGEEGAHKREVGKLIDTLREFAPDVVHLPDAFFVAHAAPIRRELGGPVVCTLTGEDIFLEKLPEPHRGEAFALLRRHAPAVDAFLCVSRHYAHYAVEHFGVPASRVHAVPLGIHIETDAIPTAPAAARRPFTIGYLARICHDKGLHLLAEAFELLHTRGRTCRLVIAGYLGEADRAYFEGVRDRLRRAGLEPHVELLGEVDRAAKFAALRGMDVLSVPTTYREAKGLYVLEALSQGVPVVQPAHGSFPELIEATGGGLLVEPHSAPAVADAIERLMNDADLRRRLGDAGRRAVRERFTDDIMADAAWRVFETVVKGKRDQGSGIRSQESGIGFQAVPQNEHSPPFQEGAGQGSPSPVASNSKST